MQEASRICGEEICLRLGKRSRAGERRAARGRIDLEHEDVSGERRGLGLDA